MMRQTMLMMQPQYVINARLKSCASDICAHIRISYHIICKLYSAHVTLCKTMGALHSS